MELGSGSAKQVPPAVDDDQEFEKIETVSIYKEAFNWRFMKLFKWYTQKKSITSKTFIELIPVKCLNIYLII